MTASSRVATTPAYPAANLEDQARTHALHGALFMVALAVPTLIAAGFDERTLAGAGIWAKPLKFQLSLALHLGTVALLVMALPTATRASRLVRWSTLAAAFASVAEICYITLQAARGRGSHFNTSTPLEAALYPIMGIGAVTIVAGSLILGIVFLRQRSTAMSPGLRLGAGLGLTLGSLATLVVAGFLSSQPNHWIGGTGIDTNSLPLFGWSTTGGDLRVSHFFATHAMQALPLVGLLASRVLPARAPVLVVAATGLWLLITLATFGQALLGLPFIRL